MLNCYGGKRAHGDFPGELVRFAGNAWNASEADQDKYDFEIRLTSETVRANPGGQDGAADYLLDLIWGFVFTFSFPRTSVDPLGTQGKG